MQIVIKKSCPYSTEDLLKRTQVGLPKNLHINLRGLGNIVNRYAVDHSQEKREALERFGKRPERVPWPWESTEKKGRSDG